MTREGFPGVVTEIEDGPHPGNEQYVVLLDGGMGGGNYSPSELQPLNAHQGSVADPHDLTCASCGKETYERSRNGYCSSCAEEYEADWFDDEEDSIHTADLDYPELGSILVDRPPLEHTSRRIPVTHEATIGETLLDIVTPESWVERGMDAPDRSPSYDWCRFRRDSHCWYPREIDFEATKEAGYCVWVPEDRGWCPRQKWDAQKVCPVSEPGPKSREPNALIDATIPWEEGGQRGGRGVMGSIHRDIEHDLRGVFEFTAAWSEVRSKAKKIRSEGNVKIIAVADNVITAHVKGEHGVYETRIMRVPGSKSVGMWECGCKWATYSWARSGRWKKYEGRMCSHALALNFEVQSQSIFDRKVMEYGKQPFPGQKVHTPDSNTGTPPPWRIGMVTARVNLSDMTVEDMASYLTGLAQKEEPKLTRLLDNIAHHEGGELEGLNFRLKNNDSIIRKIRDKGQGYIPNDVLRYTMVFHPALYADSVQDALWGIQEQGYRIVEEENTWLRGDPYSALHYVLESPTGFRIELQFHTGESYVLKQNVTHKLYTEFRNPSTPLARRQELFDIMSAYYDQLPIPEDALDFPVTKQYARPTASLRVSLSVCTCGHSDVAHDGDCMIEGCGCGCKHAMKRVSTDSDLSTPPVQIIVEGMAQGLIRGRVRNLVSIVGDGQVRLDGGEIVDYDEVLYPSWHPTEGLSFSGSHHVAEANVDGVMIALRPPDDVLGALIVDGGEDFGNMHITLAYMGKANEVDPAMVHQAAAVWAQKWGPFTGRISGYGVFQNGENVLVALPDIPTLDRARDDLLDELAARGVLPKSDHGYTPHLTLAYGSGDVLGELPAGAAGEFRIDDVIVAVGGEWTHYGLGILGSELIAEASGTPDEYLFESVASNMPPLGWDTDNSIDEVHIEAESILQDEPEPALPETYGDDPTISPEDSAYLHTPDFPRTSGLQTGLEWIIEGSSQGDSQDIAAAAEEFLAKSAAKTFSPGEQAALINEGDDGRTARNLDLLQIEGTHYEALEAALSADEEDFWTI
jgi:hypothetical protein